MTTLDNNMIITSTALTHASKELINQREFDSSSIITVGSPTILSGIASSFSATSYFKKEDLDFSNIDKVEIDINGTFLISTSNQVLFTLQSQTNKVIRAIVSNSNTKILFGNEELLNIAVDLKNEDKVAIKLQVTSTSTDLLVFVNQAVYQTSAIGGFSDYLVSNYTLYIGSDPAISNLYWTGSIDLKDAIIKLNGNEYFSTGELKGYTFTKLLVSDGTIELTDSSYAVLNHVVECPLEEVVRTNNNILLKATVTGITSAIQEVGLYCYDGSNSVLFSTISNLGIRKSSDLEYSLILHVNLDINVVNTTFFPEIIINDEDSVKMSDFEKVKRDFTYMTSNLERMIKENSLGLGYYKDSLDIINSATSVTDTRVNALGLEEAVARIMTDSKPSGVGYNKAQVNYRKQKNFNEVRNAYNAVLDYGKVQEKYQYVSEKNFTEDNLTKIGTVTLNDKGEASVFSEADYIKATTFSNDFSSFDITMSFKVDSVLSRTGTICCFGNNSVVQPLTLSINQSMLHITLGQEEKLVVISGSDRVTYSRGNSTTTHSDTTYYSWNYSGLKSFPTTLYTTVVAPTTSDKLYTTSYEEYEGSISALSTGTIIDEDLVRVKTGATQNVKVTFDGSTYKVFIENDGNYTLLSTKVTPLKIGLAKEILFGVGYSGSDYTNPFYGTLYLADFSFTNSYSTLNFLTEKVLNSIVLKDYYHIPLEIKSYYDVPNLNYFYDNYTVNIQEGLLQGKKDNIDFSNESGFSLSIKAKLEDVANKVILSRIIPDSSLSYFTFEVKDNNIVFSLYAKDETVVLTKKLDVLNFRRYLNYQSLFSVMYEVTGTDSATCKFYMNKELLSSVKTGILSFDKGNYTLANYLEDKSVADKNYVSDILSFTGVLSEEDLYYLCNILDTNF